MLRLVERSEGCHVIRHFYRDHATWQVDRKGVFFLREHGVSSGYKFPTEVFMEMSERGLVYTEAGIGRVRERPGD